MPPEDYSTKFNNAHRGYEMAIRPEPLSLRDLANAAISSGNLKDTDPELVRKIINAKNLKGTDAGQKAQELDAADGKKDGKISAAIWNAYAKEHGGNTIKNEISVEDAMNSITKYSVEEQIKAKKEKAKELKGAEVDASKSLKESQTDTNVELGKENFGL